MPTTMLAGVSVSWREAPAFAHVVSKRGKHERMPHLDKLLVVINSSITWLDQNLHSLLHQFVDGVRCDGTCTKTLALATPPRIEHPAHIASPKVFPDLPVEYREPLGTLLRSRDGW